MTNIEIFNSAEFGSVRIVQEGDRCLFCAFDVARALVIPFRMMRFRAIVGLP